MNGYKIVHEFLMDSKENPFVKKERLSKPFVYLYHGTPINLLHKIKMEGLRVSEAGKYLRIANVKNPNVLFFTSSFEYAKEYSKMKMPVFRRSKWVVLRCKLNTKYLELVMSSKLFGKYIDEYVYSIDVPVGDIQYIEN